MAKNKHAGSSIDDFMRDEGFEVVRGSGNVFRDLGMENADREQLRARLAGEIIKALDADKLTVRVAEALTGIAAADFSRIRNVRLDRFTIDRLMMILDRLGRDVDVTLSVTPRDPVAQGRAVA
ncbi:MAG: helix-turn-helix transcriptional regulator [Caulobacter sp.]|nr:helix-turn-helix transcriptional regulator [Caulobacter sp.]